MKTNSANNRTGYFIEVASRNKFRFAYRVLSALLIFSLVSQQLLPVVRAADGQTSSVPPTWSPLRVTGPSPIGRGGQGQVYNSASNRMIMFAGYADTQGLAATPTDVWVLTNANGLEAFPSTWVQLLDSRGAPGFPTPRFYTSTAYEQINNRMIAFGGRSASQINLNDVWILSNADGSTGGPQWMQLNIAGNSPSPRESNFIFYDSTKNRLIVYGGYSLSAGNLNDIWVLSNANGIGGVPVWTQLSPNGLGPQNTIASLGRGGGYDEKNNRLIAFILTKSDGQYKHEVWVLTNANGLGGAPEWILLHSAILPPARTSYMSVYDSLSNQLLILGGFPASVLDTGARPPAMNDLWVLKNANGLGGDPVWTQLSPINSNYIGGRDSSGVIYGSFLIKLKPSRV